jgi:hypothetical protein
VDTLNQKNVSSFWMPSWVIMEFLQFLGNNSINFSKNLIATKMVEFQNQNVLRFSESSCKPQKRMTILLIVSMIYGTNLT